MKRTIESLTPPANKQVMWLDISQEVKQLKAYINGKWVVVNDDTKNNEEIVNNVLKKIDKDFESYIKKEDADKAYAPKSDLEKKVDKVQGKGLSTEDFTSAEKTKLEGIAEGATNVIVDDVFDDESTNAIQNKVVTETIFNKADKEVFSDGADGLVPAPLYDDLSDPGTAVLTASGNWMQSYNADESREAGTFLAAPVEDDDIASFRKINIKDLPEDIVLDDKTYGISWLPNVGDPIVTRVGNMLYHKTLPIQNNMKGCIAQMKNGAKIMYFLDPTDWRWRENPTGNVLSNQALTVTENTYTLTNTIFNTLQYENQWLKINNIPCQVLAIDTSTNTATIKPDSSIGAGNYDVELGAVLNGYDGEVMVEVPEFWIKSWDTATRREVRISPSEINNTWEYQPSILIAAYHDTVLNTVPENMGYLSTLKVNSALSIANIHDYCRGGGNDATDDKYITSDRFRSGLGKPRTYITRNTMRTSCRNSGKEILSYLQYKRVLYWLYFIEYANFDCQAGFNSELTSEGFRQGGLGEGVVGINSDYWELYNNNSPLTPNGYTNEFGNGTNVKAMTLLMPTVSGGEPTYSTTRYVPRWHGIENPFGDIQNSVDGIIINGDIIVENGKKYNKVYATDVPAFYNNSNYRYMEMVGIELNEKGYVKEWGLGNTAEIIPRLNGGNATQYKCAQHLAFSSNGSYLRQLYLGGSASADSTGNGLGRFTSSYGMDTYFYNVGFRSSCIIEE